MKIWKLTFLSWSRIGDLFWYFQRYYALWVTPPSEIWAAFNTAGTNFLCFFFFFFVNSYRCFVSVLKWISLSCTCQLNRAEVGSAGGLIRTEVCVERVPLCGCRKRLWNAPLSTKDCVGISLQLMYHNTQCNVICFLLCGCLSADPSCCTVLLSLSVFVCIDYGQQ